MKNEWVVIRSPGCHAAQLRALLSERSPPGAVWIHSSDPEFEAHRLNVATGPLGQCVVSRKWRLHIKTQTSGSFWESGTFISSSPVFPHNIQLTWTVATPPEPFHYEGGMVTGGLWVTWHDSPCHAPVLQTWSGARDSQFCFSSLLLCSRREYLEMKISLTILTIRHEVFESFPDCRTSSDNLVILPSWDLRVRETKPPSGRHIQYQLEAPILSWL